MKTMFLLIGLMLLLVSCNATKEDQRQKEYLDALLRGESISVNELERNMDGTPSESHLRRLPSLTATYLGYSDDDIQRLREVRLTLIEKPEKE